MSSLEDLFKQSGTLRAALLLDAQGNLADFAGSGDADPDALAAVLNMARPHLHDALEVLGFGRPESLCVGTAEWSVIAGFGSDATVVLLGSENRSLEVLHKKLDPTVRAIASSFAQVPK
jgi:predicted regulator of Ras-like GTPase activity (Roadblock/LC7/MglB family)